ncbi:MAG: hypothetical protein AB7H97_09055 [Pseudobdellovibrionaceae bacterium]
MKISKFVAALTILSFLSSAYSAEGIHPSYRENFGNSEMHTFDGSLYAFINHAVQAWDPQGVSYHGIRNLIQFTKEYKIPSFGFVSQFGGPGLQFYSPKEVTYIAVSDAGQHRLSFSQAKNFILSGGNFSLCFCELMRDLIHGTTLSTNSAPLQLFLVADGIYENGQWSYDNGLDGAKFNLETLIKYDKSKDKRGVLKYFETYVGGGRKDSEFCPSQNFFHFPIIVQKNYRYRIFIEDKELGVLGKGATEIRFIIVNSKNIKQTLTSHDVRF